MNLREALILRAGSALVPGFAGRAAAFGEGGGDRLARLNLLLSRARALLPAYDKACEAAGIAGPLSSPDDISRLPVMDRTLAAGYSGGAALATLRSGGTSGAAGAETRLGREAVLLRYAALLSALKTAGWRMGERVIALHPAEYGYLENLPSMLASLHLGRAAFEFFQQGLLYRVFHNRSNLIYRGSLFTSEREAAALAARAAAAGPRLLISRPDALMAVLKSMRAAGSPRFEGLRAVLTVGTALGASVRREAEERLGAPVFNMYASTELGYMALSCSSGGEWLHADGAGHILEAGPDCLLCTDLDNDLAPLIRYATGDAGELRAGGCACGRGGPMLRVLGRAGKFVETGEGRLYEAALIDKVFTSDLAFFQLDREAGTIMLPPGSAPSAADETIERLGLPRGGWKTAPVPGLRLPPSGKFCYLP